MFYLSFLSNDRDVKGVLVNIYNLRKYGCNHPYKCICLHTIDSATKSLLKYNGIQVIVRNFETFLKDTNVSTDVYNLLMQKAWWGKLMMFDIVSDNEKCVYLDADIFIFKNLDILFTADLEYNKLLMVNDMALVGNQTTNDYNIVLKKNLFNSGVIVFSNNDIVDKIKSLLQTISLKSIQSMYGDQDVINYLYNNKKISIDPLKIHFNVWPQMADVFEKKGLLKKEDIYIIHYVCDHKPWENALISRTFYFDSEKNYYLLWNKRYHQFLEECIHVHSDKMKIHDVFERPFNNSAV